MEKAKKKDLDELLEEALASAPSIEGYSIRQLSDYRMPMVDYKRSFGTLKARVKRPYVLW